MVSGDWAMLLRGDVVVSQVMRCLKKLELSRNGTDVLLS